MKCFALYLNVYSFLITMYMSIHIICYVCTYIWLQFWKCTIAVQPFIKNIRIYWEGKAWSFVIYAPRAYVYLVYNTMADVYSTSTDIGFMFVFTSRQSVHIYAMHALLVCVVYLYSLITLVLLAYVTAKGKHIMSMCI